MKKTILILALLIGSFQLSFSTHVVGGEIHFDQTGANTFNVVMRIYRDYSEVSLGSTQSITIMDAVTCSAHSPISMKRTAGPDNGGTLIPFGDDCYKPNLCVEEHYYTGTVTLPNNPNGYMATWIICARNTTNNLVGQPCAGLYTKIPDPALVGGNYSPKFVDYPEDAYLCVNNWKCADLSATDADGDSLSYELITPIISFSGCTINSAPCAPGHGVINPLGPGSTCTINAKTGCVLTNPGQQGVYVLSVVCSEWRNGIKIGEAVRDLQYSSLVCRFDLPPTLENFKEFNVFDFDQERCIDIVATDGNPTDPFYVDITSNAYAFGAVSTLPPTNVNGLYDFQWVDNNTGMTKNIVDVDVKKLTQTKFEGIGAVGARFCWNPNECDVLSVDTFYVNVEGFSIGCDASMDTVRKEVKIVVERGSKSYNVPNVFSPDGDGINDEFYLKKDVFDRCYDALSVKIYNRWGQQVFESDDAKFIWDGNDESGKALAPGTYFVVLQGLYGGKEVTQNYSVTLFR